MTPPDGPAPISADEGAPANGADASSESMRFADAMPRPLLLLFLALGLGTAVMVVVMLVQPPHFATVSLGDRRPPPSGTYSHDAGRVVQAPLPPVIPPFSPPCDAVRTVKIIAGAGGVSRLTEVLAQACTLAGRGVAPELTEAVRGLQGATIRFGLFDRTGVESTVDFATRTISLNAKFSLQKIAPVQIVPVLLHDAWHLARAGVGVTAAEELGARRAEVAACRELIPVSQWKRWCQDARALTEAPVDRATQDLVSAGYQR